MQNNISRPAGPPSPRAESIAPITFDAATRAALAEWIAQAPDAPELAGRNEAVRRIVRCVELRSRSLELEQLLLTELPALLFDMDWIESLSLPGNRLVDTPAELLRLDAMCLLDLRSNQITDITDNIRRIPSRCSIILTGNPLPRETRAHWQNEEIMLRAPNLIFDRPGIETFAQTTINPPRQRPAFEALVINHIRLEVIWNQALRQRGIEIAATIADLLPGNHHGARLSEAINLWRLSAAGYGALLPRLLPEEARELNQTEHADSFATWLLRLTETADYHNGAAERTLHHARVSKLLAAIIEHPDLRSLCFAIAHDALESCGDRVALALNQMDMALLNHRAEQGELDTPALFSLGRRQYRMEALEKISLRHAQRLHREHEAIEVFLAYQVGLRAQLDLPVGNRAMLYRASSHVEDKDLEQAAADIESAERQAAAPLLEGLCALDTPEHAASLMLSPPPRHPLAQFLAQYSPWQQLIHRRHEAEHTRHTDTMYACLDVLTAQLEEGKINEAQYREATEQTMFFANSGLPYRHALESIAADQRA